MEILASAGRKPVDLLAGIVHLVECGVYAVAMLQQKNCVCKPFHFCCRKSERESPLVSGDSLAILIEVIPNFFHDFLIFGIVTQVVVVLVSLEPGIIVIAESDRTAQPG